MGDQLDLSGAGLNGGPSHRPLSHCTALTLCLGTMPQLGALSHASPVSLDGTFPALPGLFFLGAKMAPSEGFSQDLARPPA